MGNTPLRSGPTRREVCAGAFALAATGCASRGGVAKSAPSAVELVYDEHGSLFVEALVAGRERVLLILDTGASRSALSSALVERLGLPLHSGGLVEGSAGVVEVQAATAEIEIEGARPLVVDATVYALGSYEPRCQGILGYELLAREPFQVRYAERRLVLGGPAPERRIPLVLENRIPRVEALVDGVPLELRLDTGASLAPSERSYVNLSPGQAAALAFSDPPVAVFTATGTGGATLELPVHRLGSLEIAGVELPQAFAIVQPAVGYFARPEAVGFLGNSVLDKLDPYCDYAAGVFGVDA
jgi:predicted aspartyl protease